MIVKDIKHIENNTFSALVNGNLLKVNISPNLIEDIKCGWHDQGTKITPEDAYKLLSKEFIKYYKDNLHIIREDKLNKLLK